VPVTEKNTADNLDLSSSLNQSNNLKENQDQDLPISGEGSPVSGSDKDDLQIRKQLKHLDLELLLRNNRITTLENQLNEAQQSKKELKLDVDTLEAQLENRAMIIWWMRIGLIVYLIILLLVTAAFIARYIVVKREVEANYDRITFLRNKEHRTVEEAVECYWRARNYPPDCIVNWDKPSLKYSLLVCNKKVIGRWASIEVAIIYRPDGKASCADFYLLHRDDNFCWNVIDQTIKSPRFTDLPPDIPEEIKRQLGW